jgi:hypothetical protein
MKRQNLFTWLGAIYLIVGLAGVVGWVMNIVDIANSDFDNITGMLVIRVIGVFVPPLGAVLGYF